MEVKGSSYGVMWMLHFCEAAQCIILFMILLLLSGPNILGAWLSHSSFIVFIKVDTISSCKDIY